MIDNQVLMDADQIQWFIPSNANYDAEVNHTIFKFDFDPTPDWFGVNNMNANPNFIGPGEGNYRLCNSPAIDAGNNGALPDNIYGLLGVPCFGNHHPIDLDFVSRIFECDTVDLGAYERGCDVGECPGDLNGDGVVDGSDLLILLSSWESCSDPCDCPADLNCDGIVDGSDLLILQSNWGECSNAESAISQELLEECYDLYGHDSGEFLACVFSSEELQSMFGEGEEEQ